MKQKTIAVLFGGCSAEYFVSLASAHAVLTHLDSQRYHALPIGITQDGQWFLYTGDLANIRKDAWHRDSANCIPAWIAPDRGIHGIVLMQAGGAKLLRIDMAFPILHGKNGEDGTVQGLIELAGIPLIGCGALSSALCMDKDRAHRLASLAGVQIPKAVTVSSRRDLPRLPELMQGLRLPVFVKPVRAGSSLGITKVVRPEELLPAAELALEYDDAVILEEEVLGFEVGCAVLGTEELTVGRVDQIELAHGFFDYAEKYTPASSQIHMPARISKQAERRVQEAAKVVYRALGCSCFARVDMFLTPDGTIVFNEVNTIPGFTAHSRFPAMLGGIGLSFSEVVDKLIALGAPS